MFLTFVLFLEPPTIIPFSFGEHPVNQGDSAQLMCAVTRGDRPLSITWSLKGDIIGSDPVLTTIMIGQQTSLLIIAAVDYQHSQGVISAKSVWELFIGVKKVCDKICQKLQYKQ